MYTYLEAHVFIFLLHLPIIKYYARFTRQSRLCELYTKRERSIARARYRDGLLTARDGGKKKEKSNPPPPPRETEGTHACTHARNATCVSS